MNSLGPFLNFQDKVPYADQVWIQVFLISILFERRVLYWLYICALLQWLMEDWEEMINDYRGKKPKF